MPRPALRTRSEKRHRVKSSGGRIETHYEKEKTEISRCAQCDRTLSGLPRPDPSKLRRLPASQRRVERMYGGYLCHSCLKELLRNTARIL